MEEKEILAKLKELRKIKPSHDWEVLVKANILGEERKMSFVSALEIFPRFVLRYNKFAFATVFFFAMAAGAFAFSQNSLPGDPTFVLKKITENVRMAFVPAQDVPQAQLQMANQRLNELSQIAESNQSQKLAPAIQEFQANVSKAAEAVVNAKNPDITQIVSETQKIEKTKQQVEALGVVVGGTDDLNSALLQLLQREINDLKVRSLTPDQQKIFIEAVNDFNAGDYGSALEKIYLLSNSQNN